jgi:hypothetical protein
MYETTRTGVHVNIGKTLKAFAWQAEQAAEAYEAYRKAKNSGQPTDEPRRIYEVRLESLRTRIESLRTLGIIELE